MENSNALTTRFMVGADLFDSLASQWPETFPNLEETLRNLLSPPNATTLRVACWDSRNQKLILEQIRDIFTCSCGCKPLVCVHARLPDAIVIRKCVAPNCEICCTSNFSLQVNSPDSQRKKSSDDFPSRVSQNFELGNGRAECLINLHRATRKVVLVYPKCGEAVLRGAHVYSRGVLASESGISRGDLVEVFSMPVPAKQSYTRINKGQSGCVECERLDKFDAPLQNDILSCSRVKEAGNSTRKSEVILGLKRLNGSKGIYEENPSESPKDSSLIPTAVCKACLDAASLHRFSQLLRGSYLNISECNVIRKLGVFCGIGRIATSMGDIYKATGGIAIHMLAGHDLSGLPSWLVAQNLPSIAVARILNPLPGEKVLDMCAAPGHKTSHLASLMNQKGILIAVERSQRRLLILEAELARLGVDFVECVRGDSTKNNWSCSLGPAASLLNYFDKIMVDAPCSGLGLRPRISFAELSKTYLLSCADYQKRFLKSACDLLRVGGFMTFSTCSISPQENELNVQWALENLPLQLVSHEILLEESQDMRDAKPGEWKREIDLKCYRFPPCGHCIGFFVAKFKKISVQGV